MNPDKCSSQWYIDNNSLLSIFKNCYIQHCICEHFQGGLLKHGILYFVYTMFKQTTQDQALFRCDLLLFSLDIGMRVVLPSTIAT